MTSRRNENEMLRQALKLAVDMLAPYEPGDSRAVSNEFVALAALLTGLNPDEERAVMDVIDAANRRNGT